MKRAKKLSTSVFYDTFTQAMYCCCNILNKCLEKRTANSLNRRPLKKATHAQHEHESDPLGTNTPSGRGASQQLLTVVFLIVSYFAFIWFQSNSDISTSSASQNQGIHHKKNEIWCKYFYLNRLKLERNVKLQKFQKEHFQLFCKIEKKAICISSFCEK